MDCVAAGDSPATDDSSETSTGIMRGLGRLSKPQTSREQREKWGTLAFTPQGRRH